MILYWTYYSDLLMWELRHATEVAFTIYKMVDPYMSEVTYYVTNLAMDFPSLAEAREYAERLATHRGYRVVDQKFASMF